MLCVTTTCLTSEIMLCPCSHLASLAVTSLCVWFVINSQPSRCVELAYQIYHRFLEDISGKTIGSWAVRRTVKRWSTVAMSKMVPYPWQETLQGHISSSWVNIITVSNLTLLASNWYYNRLSAQWPLSMVQKEQARLIIRGVYYGSTTCPIAGRHFHDDGAYSTPSHMADPLYVSRQYLVYRQYTIMAWFHLTWNHLS